MNQKKKEDELHQQGLRPVSSSQDSTQPSYGEGSSSMVVTGKGLFSSPRPPTSKKVKLRLQVHCSHHSGEHHQT